MKKILLRSAAAICAIIGSSAFKGEKITSGIYYFDVQTNGVTRSSLLDNVDVMFIGRNKPLINPCVPLGHFACVVGISIANLTQINFTKLATQGFGITQQPIATIAFTGAL